MKAMPSMLLSRAITKLFPRNPVLVPVSTSAYLHPVEIKRFIRNLRATRQY
jgi:hypothetical protein